VNLYLNEKSVLEGFLGSEILTLALVRLEVRSRKTVLKVSCVPSN